ncbi:hypothetical protein [Pseudomonas sp. bs2935]|uniref:hypothetical protein n=1 Tax=Pseudomonas sp. bs2935 TaxID=1761895 RepID=UPI00087B5AFA|nr:hypothetical protein [Pseudomonas sp. bs2935]SDT00497.1 hypothetical protein SAMN04490210_4465 [Pseudomonas sp. bs2935]
MVTRLHPPTVDDVILIDDVVDQRQQGRNSAYFERIRTPWKMRIRNYIRACGNPEVLVPWADAVKFKTRFLTLYNSPKLNSVQKPVLEKLRERTLQMCPACGEDGTPNTLDHYLPKNSFPDFSITAVNLSPMCDKCQGKKLEKVLSNDGERLFLHPYFDEFLDQQVINLRIGEPYSAPESMELYPSEALSQELQELVFRHITSLGINIRYYHFFREQYTHLLGSAADIRDAGLEMRQQLVLFRNKARRKSVNSWGHIFYESVLANEELILHLETAELPELEAWAQAYKEEAFAERRGAV